MKKILIVLPLQESDKEYFLSQLSKAGEDYSIIFRNTVSEASAEEIASASIIIGEFPAGRVPEAASLEWLQVRSAGVDAYLAPGILPDNVILTNSKGAYSLTVSEHMAASTFVLIRRFPQYMRNQAAHIWKPMGNIISIEGSTIIVLGLGDIGSRYAKMMKALGAYVIGFRRTDCEKPDYVDEQYTMDRLPGIIGRADIVTMVLPGAQNTEHLMDSDMLHRMKKGSFLINNGRGNAVDFAALRQALDEGHIAGAALDVTEPEPLPADDPIWDYDNVLITPHVAGNFWLAHTLKTVIRIAGDNLRRYINNEPMHNVIDRSKGY